MDKFAANHEQAISWLNRDQRTNDPSLLETAPLGRVEFEEPLVLDLKVICDNACPPHLKRQSA